MLKYFFVCANPTEATTSSLVGINYGELGNNLPSPTRSVALIQSLNASRVKIYGANPDILRALAGTGLRVSIMVPNQLISNISSSQSLADSWVQTNLLPFLPDTNISVLFVGNEVLSFYGDQQAWLDLVPAMRRLQRSLQRFGVQQVKVGTPLAMDSLESSFPPSNGTFRSDIAEPVIRPLLQFLNRTRSYFYIDVYTYFAWAASPNDINLAYALLRITNQTYTDPVSGFTYNNLLDQMLDALAFAMNRLGYPGIRIWISETGWPSAGDSDEIGATIENAAAYNRNLVRKITRGAGTPARPGYATRADIFALYNENEKPGPGTERNWGLFYPNGTMVYQINLAGVD